MEEQGEVTLLPSVAEVGQTGKTYEITLLGRERWRQLMLTYPQERWVNARSRFAIKFFFFSHLEPAERLQLLEYRLMQCQLRLAHRQSQPKQLDVYQTAVWQRSLNVIESEIQWLTQQLANELSPSDSYKPDPSIAPPALEPVQPLKNVIRLSS